MAKLKSAGITRQVPNFQGRPLSFLDRFAHPMGWKPALNPVKHCSFRKGRDPSPTNLCLRSANPVMFPPSEIPPKSSRGFSSLQCVGSFFVFFFFLGGGSLIKTPNKKSTLLSQFIPRVPRSMSMPQICEAGADSFAEALEQVAPFFTERQQDLGLCLFRAPPKRLRPPRHKKGLCPFCRLPGNFLCSVGWSEREGGPKIYASLRWQRPVPAIVPWWAN